jgi:hypothetical protein
MIARQRVLVALGVGLFSLLVPSAARAGIIAQWTFEVNVPTSAGPIAPETGSGAASASHAGASNYAALVGNGSAHSYSSNNWQVGDSYQFTTSTLGLQNIRISWDQTSTINGPGFFDLRYSTDGTNFTTFYSYISQQIPWKSTTYNPASTYTADLSSIAALNNAPAIYFELIDTSLGAIGGGQVGPGGTSSVDNFTISSVPEPSSLLLAAVPGGWWLVRRRRSGGAS